MNLFVVAVEEFEEAGLSSGRAFDPAKTKVIARSLDVPQIHEKILNPETGTLADCRQLRWSENKRIISK